VVDSNTVAVLYGIQDLEENTPGKFVIANVLSSFGDVGKEISLRAIFNDNICAVRSVHDLHQRDDIGMGTSTVMQLHLSLLELSLPRLQADLVEGFDGIGSIGLDVQGSVDDTVRAHSKDTCQLESSGEDLT
jgi:hypothetical protein